jgi:BirA family biotin operon repressor/biotin-[acetyl-CoA-carboxylase] ligase
VVIGTGFNLNLEPSDFPEELRPVATSVWMERGGLAVDRTVFLTNYLRALETRCTQAAAGFTGMRDDGWRRSWLAGRRVTLTMAGQPVEGLVSGLGPEGELLLRRDDGVVQVISSADLIRPVAD